MNGANRHPRRGHRGSLPPIRFPSVSVNVISKTARLIRLASPFADRGRAARHAGSKLAITATPRSKQAALAKLPLPL